MNLYKKQTDSTVVKTEVVCPNDTNPMNILKGGRLMDWMDIAAAICAQKHSGMICVTACITYAEFIKPVHLGDIVTICANITRSFRSSLEVQVLSYVRTATHARNHLACEAYFTFVALNDSGKPALIPSVKPAGARDKEQFKLALERRKIGFQLRNKKKNQSCE